MVGFELDDPLLGCRHRIESLLIQLELPNLAGHELQFEHLPLFVDLFLERLFVEERGCLPELFLHFAVLPPFPVFGQMLVLLVGFLHALEPVELILHHPLRAELLLLRFVVDFLHFYMRLGQMIRLVDLLIELIVEHLAGVFFEVLIQLHYFIRFAFPGAHLLEALVSEVFEALIAVLELLGFLPRAVIAFLG